MPQYLESHLKNFVHKMLFLDNNVNGFYCLIVLQMNIKNSYYLVTKVIAIKGKTS